MQYAQGSASAQVLVVACYLDDAQSDGAMREKAGDDAVFKVCRTKDASPRNGMRFCRLQCGSSIGNKNCATRMSDIVPEP
jgi:hypothetical protein